MTSFHRLALQLDQPPLDFILRGILGFLTLPLTRFAAGAEPRGWQLVVVLAFLLAALRVVPGIIRKLVAFPEPVRAVWSERRQIAKRFDSYQWRKLTAIGIGLAVSVGWSKLVDPIALGLVIVCLLSGIAGTLVWRRHAATRPLPAVSAVAKN
jgi:hypothetical protein